MPEVELAQITASDGLNLREHIDDKDLAPPVKSFTARGLLQPIVGASPPGDARSARPAAQPSSAATSSSARPRAGER